MVETRKYAVVFEVILGVFDENTITAIYFKPKLVKISMVFVGEKVAKYTTVYLDGIHLKLSMNFIASRRLCILLYLFGGVLKNTLYIYIIVSKNARFLALRFV